MHLYVELDSWTGQHCNSVGSKKFKLQPKQTNHWITIAKLRKQENRKSQIDWSRSRLQMDAKWVCLSWLVCCGCSSCYKYFFIFFDKWAETHLIPSLSDCNSNSGSDSDFHWFEILYGRTRTLKRTLKRKRKSQPLEWLVRLHWCAPEKQSNSLAGSHWNRWFDSIIDLFPNNTNVYLYLWNWVGQKWLGLKVSTHRHRHRQTDRRTVEFASVCLSIIQWLWYWNISGISLIWWPAFDD